MTRILLTAAGGSAAFNFNNALSLTGKDYYVVGSDVKPYHIELNNLKNRYLVPTVDDPEYLPAINRIIAKEKIDLVHPQPDVEVAFMARHAKKLHAKTFLPNISAIDLCHDKMKFNRHLAQKGVSVPTAVHITSKAALEKALKDLLKTHPKVWMRAIRGAGSRASLPVNNMYQADAWVDYWRNFRGLDYADFMVSEFLPGKEFAWQSLWFNGKLITSQARERVEYIFGALVPSGQTSSPSVAKTVSRDDVNATGEAAVRAVMDKPHGVFCVDMKEDANNVPKVTEINIGRFFTTSNFFAHAGLNMPNMYVELATTGKLNSPKPKQYNPLPEDLYWVRMIDMGFKLIKGDGWKSAPA